MADEDQLRRGLEAALARFCSIDAAHVTGIGDTINRVQHAVDELARDEPRETLIKGGLLDAFVNLGRLPETANLRRSLRVLAWQVFEVSYPE